MAINNKPTTIIGQQAEQLVANDFKSRGYKIISTNWRNKWCEIDIVAQKNNIIYFVEVKYRLTNNWGDGLEAITPAKLKQMNFAAQNWLASNKHNSNAQLVVVSASGQPAKIDDIIEIN
jgi:uncharacterized protein (TIGR00252 family)